MRYSILLAFGVNPLLLFFVCDLVGTIDLFRLKFFEGEMWRRLDLAMYPVHSGELANDCNSLIFKFFSFPPFMDITYHSFSLRKSLNDDDTHTTTTKNYYVVLVLLAVIISQILFSFSTSDWYGASRFLSAANYIELV